MNPETLNTDQEFEAAFREAITCFPPPKEIEGAIADQIDRLAAAERSSTPAAVVPPASRRKRRLVRMLKWMIPSAAACAAAAILIMALLPGPAVQSASAYAEMAKAIDNSRAAQWVHFVSFNGQLETWASLHPYRVAQKSVQGVLYHDGDSLRALRYNPEQKTIEIQDFNPDAQDQASSSVFDLLISSFKEQEDRGAAIERSEAELNGKPCTIYQLKNAQGGLWKKLAVETGAERVVQFEINEQGQHIVMDFDYPPSGPQDIYALGVPRDAKIVDVRTRDEQSTLMLANAQKAAMRFDDRFRAVIGWGPYDRDSGKLVIQEIMVYYQMQHQRRWEFWSGIPAGSGLSGVSIRELEEYAKTHEPSEVDMTAPGDSGVFYSMSAREVRKGHPGQPGVFRDFVWQTISDRFGKSVPDATGPAGRLIGTHRVNPAVICQNEVGYLPVRWTVYLNPQRDYIAERSEEWIGKLDESWVPPAEKEKKFPPLNQYARGPGKTTTTVLDYAKTSSGHWYPSMQLIDGKFHGKTGTFKQIIYVDTQFVFPEGLFSPEKFEAQLARPVKSN